MATKLSEALSAQIANFHPIARALTNFKKTSREKYAAAAIRQRMTRLREQWALCLQGHATLLNLCPQEQRDKTEYFRDDWLNEHDQLCQEALDHMAVCLEDLEPFVSPEKSLHSSSLIHTEHCGLSLNHLPPIALPPFDGKPEEWENFRDRFRALILDNKELSEFTKMHFLSSSLSGRARDVIAGFSVTADSLTVAWQALTTRYENVNRLIEVHIASLINLPLVAQESAVELHALRDQAQKALSALKRLKRSNDDILSDLVSYLLCHKLDPTTRRAWKLRVGDQNKPPTYAELIHFISSRASALEDLASTSKVKSPQSSKAVCATASAPTNRACSICKQAHGLFQCPQFISKNVTQRREFALNNKRCFNCLSGGHSSKECYSKFTCRLCQQRHHTLLHLDSKSAANGAVIADAAEPSHPSEPVHEATALSSASSSAVSTSVLLATAQVAVRSFDGRAIQVRALLDHGSQLTFISESVAQALKLKRVRVNTSISGPNCVQAGVCRTAAIISISPRDRVEPSFTTLAYILRSLTTYAPRMPLNNAEWPHLSGLYLADPNPCGAESIDLIIGADLYHKVMVNSRQGTAGLPGALETHFGWVVSGATSGAGPEEPSSSINIVALHCSLEHELRKFWEIEEIQFPKSLSPDEQKCEEHFRATQTRTEDGRYSVRLPFRENPPIEIGESRFLAERRLSSLSRRFANDPQLKQTYDDFLVEYESLNHMSEVSGTAPSAPQVVYIPHHPVLRPTSTTTKLRVVFDASSQTSNGKSLNQHLLPGPKLQTDLSAVLLRWRQHKYVYTADIAKMFRQILVDLQDWCYQRILWIPPGSPEIHEYNLRTVTYGTVSAPYLALRVLQQLAVDEGRDFPLATSILRNNIYVDDLLFGAEDLPLLGQARDQVHGLLKRGGFELRKWASNKVEMLAELSETERGAVGDKLLQTEETISILGLSWNPTRDLFTFHVHISDTIPTTKRAILSTISQLFDPLGWVTPTILAAKVFMQHLWRIRVGWDDQIPETSVERWRSIYHSFPALNDISLTRWTGVGADTEYLELHGFADASTVAYAAVVYLRVKSLSGETIISLLVGKSKVAPIQLLSVPRLELCAAGLLARLMKFVLTSLELDIPCHCWTDSTVTLAWLNKHASNWKTFVAHRVQDIHSRLPNASWHYIPTQDNPADCASRGMLGAELSTHRLWWQGPSWLPLEPTEWPRVEATSPPEDILESKPLITLAAHATPLWELSCRYSWWPKLVRVTAYLKKFGERCQGKASPQRDAGLPPIALSALEFQTARLFWFRAVQAELFPAELRALQRGERISPKSPIVALNPFIDIEGLIRVGGRLENAPISFNSKHPIILSGHQIVDLIIRFTHVTHLHAGSQLTLSTLRTEFWILRARTRVRSVIHKCVVCARERARITTQLMGQLPSIRVTAPSRAFAHCGVDYAGPVFTRLSPGRGTKSRESYIALFVCLATRAVHLELVSDCSTQAFLGAYLRFCARRGLPEVIYSDNGTNFVGADKELRKAYQTSINDPDLLNHIASDRVQWKFIPPHAPHFGGLWEAGVKSVKHHLRRTLSSHTLTFEEFTTLLCQIEACLNSRPIAPMSESVDDYEVLTPSHFLIGSTLTTNPEPSTLQLAENRLSRWQLVRQVAERLWKIWQTDYINTLQQRSKWRRKETPVKVGSLVLINNPLLPPCKWERGRITECHAGADGLIRVVSVKTAHAEYKRPITKVCLLPVDIDELEAETPSSEDE